MGDSDIRRRAVRHGGCCPALVERGNRAASFAFWFWEAYSTAPHRHTGGNGNTTLLVVVHGAIEVINHTIMLHDIAFMGKHLVVGL